MVKSWGQNEFWGIGSEYDADWFLTEKQKDLRQKLIELCRTKIRPHAAHCDKTYEFPRKSLEALAELGLLGVIVPRELGGLGESHVFVSTVIETIARYGCPSTAIVYTMHVGACSSLLFRYHNNDRIKDLLSRLNKDKLIGTVSSSDPATGGHCWYSLSSKSKFVNAKTIKLLKHGAWATSAGHADWYFIQTVSPDFKGNYSDLSCFLVYKDEVRASTDDWSAIGMHGNHSGPLIVEGCFGTDRLIGNLGDGKKTKAEVVTPSFLLYTSSCWNGVSMACLDVAKKHVTRRAHADVGMRVCDYPTIQDYFGEAVCDTNVCRMSTLSVARALDAATNNNDWSIYSNPEFMPRKPFVHWLWQLKFASAKNVEHVSTTMMHACGGSGYKTDLGLERLLRDGKAGWVMGPSNEIIRQMVGKSCLMGFEVLDLWDQRCNDRILHHELGKMELSEKKILAQKILAEVEAEEKGEGIAHDYQETDFENPFNTAPPAHIEQSLQTPDGVSHKSALSPSTWTPLTLEARQDNNHIMSTFKFLLPRATDHTGCLPGQFVMVRVTIDGKKQERYISPVSRPNDFGKIEVVLRFETHGLLSQHFRALKPGDKVEFQGPCGGFEYEESKLNTLTLLASGGGITPGLQLIRCIMNNPKDTTKICLVYYSENVDEILYREELDNYEANDNRFSVIHALGEAPENWKGEEGFIDTAMINKHVLKPNGLRNKIVICGGPTMAITCLHSLRSLGFPPDCIYIYGQFGTEQIKKVFGKNVKLSGHRCDNVL